MADEFLNITQLAGWLDIREREIARLVQDGRIPYRRIGKALRFRLSHIEAWLTTLPGLDAVKTLPVNLLDPRAATNGISPGPDETPSTAIPFARGRRRHVSAPSVIERNR